MMMNESMKAIIRRGDPCNNNILFFATCVAS